MDKITVQGYDNYEVDRYGNVYSKDRLEETPRNPLMNGRMRRGRILKKMVDKKGYERVSLYRDGKLKRAPVHRLIALAFIKRECDKMVVNHIDNNKTNNNVNNLEWVTQINNIKHSINQGRHSSQHSTCEKKVRHIPTGTIYKSITLAAIEHGITKSCITNHTRNRVKIKKWEYI